MSSPDATSADLGVWWSLACVATVGAALYLNFLGNPFMYDDYRAPFGFHLTNLLLHVLAVVLVFEVTRRVSADAPAVESRRQRWLPRGTSP